MSEGDEVIVLRPAWRVQWPLMLLLAASVVGTYYGLTGVYPVPEAVPTTEILAGITGILLVVLVYRRFVWKFTVGDGRIKRHYGVIARHQQSLRIEDLRSVELEQGILQRLFNVGNLAFYSAGSAEAEVTFRGIKSPAEVRDRIHRLRDGA